MRSVLTTVQHYTLIHVQYFIESISKAIVI